MSMRPNHPTLLDAPTSAPLHWASSCTHRECTLHQLSPYIGKLKSVIARDLIKEYTKAGDLVADMFCGCGTVPLEAALLGRRVFASDASPYAITLTKAKLNPPTTLNDALDELDQVLTAVRPYVMPNIDTVPMWVQAFFHEHTLREILRLSQYLRENNKHFLLSSMLGILHHQRPGFLSFPSSHLVPYLRSHKFPRSTYPKLYEYRRLDIRLRAKIIRAFKRPPTESLRSVCRNVYHSLIEEVDLPNDIDCILTSPPYMNALDYERDNRLRIWFLGKFRCNELDRRLAGIAGFRSAMISLARQLPTKVRKGGICIFVVGDRSRRSSNLFPSEELFGILRQHAPGLHLVKVIKDTIPDIRRTRKTCSSVKNELILIFERS